MTTALSPLLYIIIIIIIIIINCKWVHTRCSALQCNEGQYRIVQKSTVQHNTITHITQNSKNPKYAKITKNKIKNTHYTLLRLRNEQNLN